MIMALAFFSAWEAKLRGDRLNQARLHGAWDEGFGAAGLGMSCLIIRIVVIKIATTIILIIAIIIIVIRSLCREFKRIPGSLFRSRGFRCQRFVPARSGAGRGIKEPWPCGE